MSYPAVINNLYPWANIDTLDIREDSLANIKCDYLTYELSSEPDVIITNPPFNMALPIIQKALDDVRDGGYVIMLLRLNFFGSKVRFPFFQKYMPKYTYVHHQRMGFTDSGGTDSVEYMHTVWQKGYIDKYTQLRVI